MLMDFVHTPAHPVPQKDCSLEASSELAYEHWLESEKLYAVCPVLQHEGLSGLHHAGYRNAVQDVPRKTAEVFCGRNRHGE